jgi:hypothetical protein
MRPRKPAATMCGCRLRSERTGQFRRYKPFGHDFESGRCDVASGDRKTSLTVLSYRNALTRDSRAFRVGRIALRPPALTGGRLRSAIRGFALRSQPRPYRFATEAGHKLSPTCARNGATSWRSCCSRRRSRVRSCRGGDRDNICRHLANVVSGRVLAWNGSLEACRTSKGETGRRETSTRFGGAETGTRTPRALGER